MSFAFAVFEEKSRLKSLLEHFAMIEDPREAWRVAHPLVEVLLLVVCATMADCDDYEAIAAWGAAHLEFLRRYRPFYYGVPGGGWLTQLMNRINPALFSAAFSAWVRETWPDRLSLIAIDGKTSRRSHDHADGKGPLHLVSAFATTNRLVLGQEAVEGKANELQDIPVLIDRLAEGGGLKGALVSVDAIATNARIAQTIAKAGGDYLLAVKANQPTLRAETQSAFAAAAALDTFVDHDRGHGRIESERSTSSTKSIGSTAIDAFLASSGCPAQPRSFAFNRAPNSPSVPASRPATTSRPPNSPLRRPPRLCAITGGIENRPHRVLDVVFAEDQSRSRKGHGAKNMAIVRHFAINLIRNATDKKA